MGYFNVQQQFANSRYFLGLVPVRLATPFEFTADFDGSNATQGTTRSIRRLERSMYIYIYLYIFFFFDRGSKNQYVARVGTPRRSKSRGQRDNENATVKAIVHHFLNTCAHTYREFIYICIYIYISLL